MLKPSDAHNQRLTFSKYYGANIAKGDEFVPLCRWMGVEELWCGAVSDSDYFVRLDILQRQQNYAQQHDPTTANIPFQNMLDKGYRVNASAWRHGKQRVIQPNFSRCDRQFTSFEVALPAAVASYRGGNERAVKYMKLSHYVKAVSGKFQT